MIYLMILESHFFGSILHVWVARCGPLAGLRARRGGAELPHARDVWGPSNVTFQSLDYDGFSIQMLYGMESGYSHSTFQWITMDVSIDWFKGKITGKSHRNHGKIYGFLQIFP